MCGREKQPSHPIATSMKLRRDRSESQQRNRNGGSNGKYDGKRKEHVDFNYKDKDDDLEEIFLAAALNADKGVLDSGATKTCVGKACLASIKEILPKEIREKMTTRNEDRSFRFGNSVRYPS